MNRDAKPILTKAYRIVLDSLPMYICIKDRDGVFLYANDAFSKLLGKGRDEIVGGVDTDFFPVKMAAQFRLDDLQVMESGGVFEQSEKVESFDGTGVHWVHVVKRPFLDDGKSVGVLCYFWDETDKKLAEQALDLSEARFNTFLQNSSDLICFASSDGKLQFVSPSMQLCLGVGDVSIIGTSILEAVAPEESDVLGAALSEAAKFHEERTLEFRLRNRKGQVFYIDAVVLPMSDRNNKQLMIIGRDVTRRKENELMLKRASEEAELLLSSLSAILIGCDTSGRVTRWNKAAEEIFGLSPVEVIGKSLDRIKVGLDWGCV